MKSRNWRGLSARVLPICLSVMVPIVASGCLGGVVNMMALPYFIMRGDARQDPLGVSLVKAKKETRRLVVIPYADFGLRNGFGALDEDLAGMLIAEIVKAEDRLKIVPERKVREWKDVRGDWGEWTSQQIGEHFDVDYVVYFEIANFKLSDPKNPYLLQGNTRVLFRVYDVNRETEIFSDVYERDFPPNRPVSVTEISEGEFQRRFLRRVAKELSWFITPHESVDPITDF